jgi:multiple sugar transport system permease protein
MFLLLTLALWTGVFLVLRAVWIGLRVALGPKGLDRSPEMRAALVSAGIGGTLLLLGSVMPKELGREAVGAWVPIVWLYTPLPGWLLLLSVAMIVSRIVQWRTALTSSESVDRLKSAAFWALVGVGSWVWFTAISAKFAILRGALPMNWSMGLGAIALLVAAMVAMVLAERTTAARGIASKATALIALCAGAVVFSIPFAWLMSTSFKEERDLANTDGLVWVPQVQKTVAFRDPEKPQYEATYGGRPVKVVKDSDLAGGKWLVEVERPYGLRGRRFEVVAGALKEIDRMQPMWDGKTGSSPFRGFTVRDLEGGQIMLEVLEPTERKGERMTLAREELEPVRQTGLRWENYSDALEWMPLETNFGLAYLVNTLWLALMCVMGTVLSCSVVAYGFSRLRFPGRDQLFFVMLMTMMLPGAVTMMPQFLIFKSLGWMDSLLPIWVPTFFAGAFNVFMLRQFFATIPMELEEAARIDGCGYWRTYWQIMLPMVKPALAVISIWTFMGAWNNFVGPLIYVSTPAKMPMSYAMGLFASDRGADIALMMSFATMSTVPVILLFFFAQKYFIEGVQLSGLGGR